MTIRLRKSSKQRMFDCRMNVRRATEGGMGDAGGCLKRDLPNALNDDVYEEDEATVLGICASEMKEGCNFCRQIADNI